MEYLEAADHGDANNLLCFVISKVAGEVSVYGIKTMSTVVAVDEELASEGILVLYPHLISFCSLLLHTLYCQIHNPSKPTPHTYCNPSATFQIPIPRYLCYGALLFVHGREGVSVPRPLLPILRMSQSDGLTLIPFGDSTHSSRPLMFHHNLLMRQDFCVQCPSHGVRSHDTAVCAAYKCCRVKMTDGKGKHSGRSTGTVHGGKESPHEIDAHIVVLLPRDESKEGVTVGKNRRAHSRAV